MCFEFCSRYQKSINRLHDLVMDQPMHPVDRAAWWMEYILRHPLPEDVMRSPVLELSWWQCFLLDVFIVSALIISIVIGIATFFVKLCCCNNRKRMKSKNE